MQNHAKKKNPNNIAARPGQRNQALSPSKKVRPDSGSSRQLLWMEHKNTRH